MSMGPSDKEVDLSPSLPSQTAYVAKKSVVAFFEQPLRYLFYGTLTCVIVGLLFGVEFSATLYAILLCLAGMEAIRYVTSRPQYQDLKEQESL